jgi:hypothetical protein
MIYAGAELLLLLNLHRHMTMKMNLIHSRRAVRLLLAFSRRLRPNYCVYMRAYSMCVARFVRLLLCTSVCANAISIGCKRSSDGWMDGRTVELAFKELLCIAKFDVLITAQ